MIKLILKQEFCASSWLITGIIVCFSQLHYGMHVSKLLSHHQKFLWAHISIETLPETQGSPDNEPKVPEQVGHKGKEEV